MELIIGGIIIIGILWILLMASVLAGLGVEKDMKRFEAEARAFAALFRGDDVKRVTINTDGFQEQFEIRRINRGAA